MAYSRERGSILGYVLVGALLIALLIGGVLVVRNNISRLEKPSAPTVGRDSGSGTDATTSTDSPAPEELSADEHTQAEERQAEEERLTREAEAERKVADEAAAKQREEQAAATKKAEEEKKAREQAARQPQEQNPSTPTPDTSAPTAASRVPTTSTVPDGTTETATDSNKLPHTGPLDGVVASTAAGALLLGATLAYLRSRAVI